MDNNNLDKTVFEDSDNVSMEELLSQYGGADNFSAGKEIEVTIIAENEDGFMADLGMKSEGLIPKKEFAEGEVPPELKAGAVVKVKVISTSPNIKLSYREVLEKAAWDTIEEAARAGKTVKGKILKTVKGGFIVDVGVRAFLHISQVDTVFVKDGASYVGNTFDFIITEFSRPEKKVTLSRRKLLENEKASKKAEALDSISEGQILDGTVSRITDFGAFIDLGGVDGLLHIGEIAWHKVKKVDELLQKGQTVRVQVLRVDKASGKISLTMKQLNAHPWDGAAEKFPEGLIVKGIVSSVSSYGAFVELEKGIEGLLHVSEYAWNDSESSFKKNVKSGDEIEVKVIALDKENKKISLSVKKILQNPWEEAVRRYAPGTKVKGVVTKLMPFGAFVKLPEGIEGLVHISDFSWAKKVRHAEDVLKVGDEVEVVVREVSPTNEKIALSIKHLSQDPFKNYKTGAVVKGKVIRTADFGVFVELEPGIEALLKNSEMTSVKEERGNIVFKEGDEIEAKVIKADTPARKIEISIKKLEFDMEKELVKKYASESDKPTLGDILTEDSGGSEEI
ncbi:MAG: S1 RNA-binding domain-containing protein [Elusimicrobia bacterium]|nr:S1 RNA-binding domain-containing protein [Elusimicrobiota bacterium]